MPLYEYRCLDCRKRSTVLQLSATNPKPASCAHCQGTRLERLMSRFASPKSEEARLESLADPDALSGLDENDPESMTRFMKKMGDELGEDMAETPEEPDQAPSELDNSDGL